MKDKKRFEELFDLIWETSKSNKNPGKYISELGLLISGKETKKIELPKPVMWPFPFSYMYNKYPYAKELIQRHKNAMIDIVKSAIIVAEMLETISEKTTNEELFYLVRKRCEENNVQAPKWRLVIDKNKHDETEIEVETFYDFSVNVDIGVYVFGLGRYYTNLINTPSSAPAIIAIKAGARAEALSYLDQVCNGNKDLAEDLIKLNTHLRGIYFSFKYLLNGVNFCCGMLSPEKGKVPRSSEERIVHLMKIILVGTYLELEEEVKKAWEMFKILLPSCKKIYLNYVSEVFGLGFAVDYSELSPEQYWNIIHWESDEYFLPKIMAKKIFGI